MAKGGRRDRLRQFEEEDPVKGSARSTPGARVDHAFGGKMRHPCAGRRSRAWLIPSHRSRSLAYCPPDAEISFPWMAIRPGMQGADLAHGSKIRSRDHIQIQILQGGAARPPPMANKDAIGRHQMRRLPGEVARTVYLTFDKQGGTTGRATPSTPSRRPRAKKRKGIRTINKFVTVYAGHIDFPHHGRDDAERPRFDNAALAGCLRQARSDRRSDGPAAATTPSGSPSIISSARATNHPQHPHARGAPDAPHETPRKTAAVLTLPLWGTRAPRRRFRDC